MSNREPPSQACRVDLDRYFGPPVGAPPIVHDQASLQVAIIEQRGLVTLQQCFAAGLTVGAIRHRVSSGRWVPLRRGVYLVEPGRSGWWHEATAALLCVGSGAAWCFGTAAYVHGLLREPPRTTHLLVDASLTPRAPSGVQIHRSRHAPRRIDDRQWPWRTTVDETILDLAEGASVDSIAALLGKAFQRNLTSQGTLLARLAQRPRHGRRDLMVELLSDVAAGAESPMEVRFVRDVERPHGLPTGRRQVAVMVQGVRIHDIAYEGQRVIVELDGRLGHDGHGRVRDGVRDRRSATRGWLTVRAFWSDVAGSPCELAGELGQVLVDRGWTGCIHPCRRPDCSVRR